MNLARVLMHAVVVRRELLSSRHPSNIPPFCKIGGQNRKIQCALINQGFSQKATSKTLKILTFLCLFSSPERRSIRRCTESHLKLKIRWANTPCGFESHFRHHRRTLIWIQLGPFFFAPPPLRKSPYSVGFFGFSHTNTCLSCFFIHAHPAVFRPFTAKTPYRPTLKSCAR